MRVDVGVIVVNAWAPVGCGTSIITRAILGGLAYFGVVFAAGFALGTLRVLVLAPKLGESTAVLVELPIILAVSWATCRWIIIRFAVPENLTARLIMDGLAFAVLFGAEIGVSVVGFGRTLLAHMEQHQQLPALIGLAGRVLYALFPVVQSVHQAEQRAS